MVCEMWNEKTCSNVIKAVSQLLVATEFASNLTANIFAYC